MTGSKHDYDSQEAYDDLMQRKKEGGTAPDLSAGYLPSPSLIERRKRRTRWLLNHDVSEWMRAAVMIGEYPSFLTVKQLFESGMTISEIEEAHVYLKGKPG